MYTDEGSQIETLEQAFHKMLDAGWDTNGYLLWGYFFVDADLSKLRLLRKRLEPFGYRFVRVFKLEAEGKRLPGEYMLHLERVESHRPETLATRNVELSQFASECGVRDYDGWDTGPVKGPAASE